MFQPSIIALYRATLHAMVEIEAASDNLSGLSLPEKRADSRPAKEALKVKGELGEVEVGAPRKPGAGAVVETLLVTSWGRDA